MTNAERQKRYRESKRNAGVTETVTVLPKNVTRNATETVTDAPKYCRHGLIYHPGCNA